MDSDGGSSKSGKKDAEIIQSGDDTTMSTGKQIKMTGKKNPKLPVSSRGIENAKKRLRAFSIQKKTPITPIVVPKATSSSSTTVIIGKLTGVKVTPKVEPDPEQKKLKPPKPGSSRRSVQDSYTELQRRTLSEIEDMKRKMELVELGIPLGLICPTSTSEKAMPTKAMPPIKSFLDPAKVDDLIREAKKAKQEGKNYKFDYQKLLPDYDNPFQKKKEEPVPQSTHEKERNLERRKSESERDRDRERDRRRADKYDVKRHDHRKEYKYKERDKERPRYDEYHKEHSEDKEAEVNLNDYLVCDSWSLENDEKNSSSSPKVLDKPISAPPPSTSTSESTVTLPTEPPQVPPKRNEVIKIVLADSPRPIPVKIEKLKPVMDSFKYEIDPNDDEILDIFDEDSGLDKYAHQTKAKDRSFYHSPNKNIVDYEPDNAKDSSLDGMNDETFLESVINEIKQENLSDESQDKGLVEYEMSPNRDEESPEILNRSSVTPEINDKIRSLSQRSDYSEGYRSSDSFKSVGTNESGYKSVESFRLSVEKELDEVLTSKMSKSTVDSLETWSFVLKICQPLLFRHDKNKCYKETRTSPKLWYVENPKVCNCVKDRSVVYKELEMCKMALVDRVYGCDQIPDAPFPKARSWYPRNSLYSTENNPVPLSSEWEAEDSQLADRSDLGSTCTTPQRSEEMSLDREYQRFMEAVWPDVVESKIETPISTTPVRQDSRKKKKEDDEKEPEDKKSKKIKLSSEGWSQESDIEEEDKTKKPKFDKEKTKSRKRKHSSSTISSSVSETDEDVRKKRKMLKKKANKQAKSKSAKRRRMGRKLLKKLKEKQKKRSRDKKDSDDEDSDKKKKLKKKKQQRLKKKALKKKKIKVQSSSSSSSSSSDSESESDRKSKKAKKKVQEATKKKVKQLRKQSTSDSTQSEDLFDVNILNNIKTERLTDDELANHKLMDFSPRRQKPREIINVKELQNDFVGNIHIKQEIEDAPKDRPKEIEKVDDEKYIPIPSDLDTNSESKTDVKEIELPKESPQPVKTPEDMPPLPPPLAPPPASIPLPVPDESNMSQSSSQESICSVSVKDAPIFYEKDESHLRPSSQNSNYSFNDVINASQNNLYQKEIKPVTANTLYDKELEINVEQELYPKEIEAITPSHTEYNKIEVTTSENASYEKDIDAEIECDEKYVESYEPANYEMYEQMAMAYQSDVASQQRSSGGAECGGESQRIETVVGARTRGEIKCDWRAGDAPTTPHRARPSRWGLKPGEVNIVLTGGNSFPSQEESEPVYHIQSLANRSDVNTGYDEAYMDMYGAADRLQYGDCFNNDINDDNIMPVSLDVSSISPTISGNTHILSPNVIPVSVTDDDIYPSVPVADPDPGPKEIRKSTLDDRIDKALRETVLGGIAKEIDTEKDAPEKGILITVPVEPRSNKRVSFADGYKPGQDSDVEEPPAKKRKRARRYGCAWPCPASHADHVPLWDALPPPPPPPGSPPPARTLAPPAHLLRHHPPRLPSLLALPAPMAKFDPTLPLPGFMPPEPPPGLIALQ